MDELKIKSSLRDYSVFFTDLNLVLESYEKEEVVFVVDSYINTEYNSLFENHQVVVLESTEVQKSFDGVGDLVKKLLELGVTRETKLVAVGGGAIQDVTSFVSSILFRGISWDFIPTTLLSQGDSCIGSKTSINFYGYKNLLGNFYPPSNIYIDISLLDTLSPMEISSGLGELLHYLIIDGENSLNMFDGYMFDKLNIRDLVNKCLLIKKEFIESDEFDTGHRILLNYGHSFGHAIEGAMKNKIPHGVAVAYGMDCANYVSMRFGMMDKKDYERYNKILAKVYSTVTLSNMKTTKMISFLNKDKKNTKTSYRFILCRKAGNVFVETVDKNYDMCGLIDQWREETCL